MAQVVETRLFREGDEEAFRRLNEEWTVRFFALEEKDRYTLGHPREVIPEKGGEIVFVTLDGEPVRCCALVAMRPHEYEIAKMGVTESAKGLGLGRRVLTAAVEEGRRRGAKRLYLETNHSLTPAIRLYESVGFTHVPKERVVASVYERADVLMEMWVK